MSYCGLEFLCCTFSFFGCLTVGRGNISMWYVVVVLGIPTSSILHVGPVKFAKSHSHKWYMCFQQHLHVLWLLRNLSSSIQHKNLTLNWFMVDSSQMTSTRLILGSLCEDVILVPSQLKNVTYGFQGFYVGWMRSTLVLRILSHLISMVESGEFIIEGWWEFIIVEIQVSTYDSILYLFISEDET